MAAVESVKAEEKEAIKEEENAEPVKEENGVNGAVKHEVKHEISEPTNLDHQIIRQIEYYFGDINLPRDKFMLEQVKLDDGWIPMSVMLKFQRLAKLTADPKVIAAALTHSQLMEVDESKEDIKIRRSPEHPLPELNEERRKELQKRTIYCKGFPLDYTMDTIIAFFKEENIENVIMRKYKDQITKSYKFKGSVFATFSTIEAAKEFVEKESVTLGKTELIKKWQLDYLNEKKKELLESRLKKSKTKPGCKEVEEKKDVMPVGATLHLTGCFEKLTREDIKQKFSDHGCETAFVSFNKGEEEAYVRLHETNSAKTLIEKVGTEFEILESKLQARLLEGEEETTFLKKAKADREAYFKKCQQARHASGGRRNKGKGNFRNDRNRKRKGSPDVEGSPPAKIKAE